MPVLEGKAVPKLSVALSVLYECSCNIGHWGYGWKTHVCIMQIFKNFFLIILKT